jgi:Tol biopolymer transport system component
LRNHYKNIAALSIASSCAIAIIGCDSPSAPSGAYVLSNRLVFRSDRQDVMFDLYSMALDGTAVKRLTSDGDDEHCPSVSPDGRWIAFFEGPRLVLMRSDGSGQTELARIGDNAEGNCPKWSHDSETIAVESVPGPIGFTYLLTVMQRDGTGIGKFGAEAATFNFSPNGAELVMGEVNSSGLSADQKIAIIARDGSSRRELTTGRDPAWSPTGNLIAYVCDNDVTVTPVNSSLCFVNADGTGQRVTQAEYPSTLAFSPDGSRIAFHCGAGEVCIASVDGTQVAKSSFQGALGPVRWTAEGDALVFACSSADVAVTPFAQSEICRAGVELDALQYLTRNPASDDSPSLSAVGSP